MTAPTILALCLVVAFAFVVGLCLGLCERGDTVDEPIRTVGEVWATMKVRRK